MKTLNEIKQSIKELAENIPGIGKVYDRYIYAFDEKQVKDLFASDGKINTLMFRPVKRESIGGENKCDELFINRLWKMRLIYGYNFTDNSEDKFDNICEELCRTFNSDLTLSGSIRKHTSLSVTDKYDSEYHGILVHNAELEMETES